jgi:hypothetical protein
VIIKKPIPTARLSQIHNKRSLTERGLQTWERDLKVREQQLDRRLSEYLDSTRERQNKELKAFTRLWQSDAMQRQYNRTSVRLRTLRRQEQLFARAMRLADAEEVGKMASVREKQETEESYRQMLRDYQDSRHRIEERHGAEMLMALDVAKRKKDEFGHFARKAMLPWSARLRKLDIDEESSTLRETRKVRRQSPKVETAEERMQLPALPHMCE